MKCDLSYIEGKNTTGLRLLTPTVYIYIYIYIYIIALGSREWGLAPHKCQKRGAELI